MKKEISKNFYLQTDQIIANVSEFLSKEKQKLTSSYAASGRLRSGGFIEQNFNLITTCITSITDKTLEFALNYASKESLNLDDLINITEVKIQTYKILAWKEWEENHLIKPMLNDSTTRIFDEKKLKINEEISLKIASARDGWVNHEKIYQTKISPSLEFFNNICLNIDQRINHKLPMLVNRFKSVYDNLKSDNPSDWNNAVHECRKIFHDLADFLFPAQEKDRIKGNKPIKLRQENYINRIVCFVEDNSNSETLNNVLSSALEDFGKKLDSIYNSTNKGSHTNLKKKESQITREQAYTFAAHTYFLVGDIIDLLKTGSPLSRG